MLLDGYELNQDLKWDALKTLGECIFYDRTDVNNPTEILKRIGDADIVITHKTPLRKEIIANAPRLKYITIMGNGYDVVDTDSAIKHDVLVSNVPTYASDSVAQFTFSLLLEVTGQVGLHNSLVHENRWSKGGSNWPCVRDESHFL